MGSAKRSSQLRSLSRSGQRTVPSADNKRDTCTLPRISSSLPIELLRTPKRTLGFRVDRRLRQSPHCARLNLDRLGPLVQVIIRLVNLSLEGVQLGDDRLKIWA